MKFKTIIFDLDGTLVDSIDGIAISMNNVLKRHGFDVHDNETYKALVGHGMKELVKKSIFNKSLDDDLLAQYFMEMKEEYTKNWDYKMSVYEEIDELLHYLYSNGIYFAVNTNKDEDISKKIIERVFSKWEFSYIVGNSSLACKKPDPSGARTKLVAENDLMQEKIKQAIHVGVNVSACKACADQLGVSDRLVELGIEVKYWGEDLTQILKENEKLLTI